MADILVNFLIGALTYLLPPILLVFAIYYIGCKKAVSAARNSKSGLLSDLHSRPTYHGAFLVLLTILPAMIIYVVWSAAEGPLISRTINANLPASVTSLDKGRQSLIMSVAGTIERGLDKLSAEEMTLLRKVASEEQGAEPVAPEAVKQIFEKHNIILGENPEPFLINAALQKDRLDSYSHQAKLIVVALVSLLGLMIGYLNIKLRTRARNGVETIVRYFLIGASVIAIFTTFAIVFSVLFETINFFQIVPPSSFFFGTVWDPRFGGAAGAGGNYGQFGFLPLLWGTLYISIVALAVAVPIGLFAAIYMSEYAGSKLRSIAKPALEILAGIPTIVYGFFALVTVGPFFRDAGELVGLQINASSVLSAGFVMGIMIIPFVSSLSDDIISAVPQSLREGSLGLGSTKSETIKKVVLPAALPGLVGAVLLAASRAIGETMIVVLAAGIAAKLSLNPFDALTTITVKIVNQLTGDHEFGTPETLVAFALGLSLFVITLMLNVYALYIVRKYREQYD